MAKAGGGRTGWLREAPLRKGDGGRDLNDKNSVLQSVLQGERTAMWQRSQGRKVIGELEEPPETAVTVIMGGIGGGFTAWTVFQSYSQLKASVFRLRALLDCICKHFLLVRGKRCLKAP